MNFEAAREDYLYKFLVEASTAYYNGTPTITDEQFDYLSDLIDFKEVGTKPKGKVKKHYNRLLSLQKYYNGEGKVPLADYSGLKISTTKLDGAAIAALYIDGALTQVLIRGDGVEGTDITEKFLFSNKSILPKTISKLGIIQVVGEITASKDIDNSRNYASGALSLLDLNEFNSRELFFTAYGIFPSNEKYYTGDLLTLNQLGFKTVDNEEWCSQFPTDGSVIRINDNYLYTSLGNTAKHPRGAYALKSRKQGVITTLLDVEWQVGKSGKVTPVAILEPVKIDSANITRATLNNIAFINALNLDIGCKVEVVRSGEIIPTIVRRVD